MFKTTQAKLQKNRLILLAALITIFFLAVEVNLFYRQVAQHDMFSKVAENQYLKKIPLRANRGGIYDRTEHKLVNNTIKYDLAADPQIVENKRTIAKACSKAFNRSEQFYLKKLNRESRFTYLARRVSEEEIGEILKLKDPGLIKTKSFRREYPYRTYAAHLLGFTDPDDQGLSGLELQYDQQLAGSDGEAVLQYDGPRRVFYNADNPIVKPQHGDDIILTIDKDIQTIVEQELENGIKKAKAKAGIAVMMDPFSGAVYAMANYPSFNPNQQKKFSSAAKRNRAITDVFEPGSTMKVLTAAALLQEQLKKENDIVYCEQGRYKVYNHYFHDTKKHGWLSFKKSVAYSSNIGMIKLSDDIPKNTLYRYLLNFGLGSETGIGLTGEMSGLLENPQKWSGVSKSSISIGYEIGVTALQMTTAYAAAINGGYLYRPYIIDHLRTPDGKIVQSVQPQVIRQVISKEVSDKLKEFMYAAVEDGTGSLAKVNGIMVGGKTGTARKMDKKTKKYSTSKYTASFIGFAPYDEPKYVLAVILDEPKTAYYGGSVAAPIFSKVIERAVHLNKKDINQDIEPSQNPDILVHKMHDIPPVTGFLVENAQSILDAKDLDYKISGTGKYVKDVKYKDETIFLECGELKISQDKVPQLVGLTMREALKRVDLSRFRIHLTGDKSGIIREQQPPPGKQVNQRTSLTLVCR